MYELTPGEKHVFDAIVSPHLLIEGQITVDIRKLLSLEVLVLLILQVLYVFEGALLCKQLLLEFKFILELILSRKIPVLLILGPLIILHLVGFLYLSIFCH